MQLIRIKNPSVSIFAHPVLRCFRVMRGNGLELQQGRFRSDIKKNAFYHTTIGCPGKWRNRHPWKCSKELALGTWFGGGRAGLTVGLKCLFQTSRFQPACAFQVAKR